ncbi:glycerol kinase [Legionella geestiana]|uniref:glycerol kinase n=1 Tax=Legionella geestiana TaxID=45065 RepID=A0A0W0TNE1_9GAMM|nr:glycerol kinase GlpK [Legionella geestiana]KTC97122.1 glycerol kinase [Legionella geestiana]QBS11476.1 glycerol kinase [Legionella geestiana]QDQ39036.1 glycerol kinase GlpK [Legionella geestiana]STX53860.1 glycerol kinase [Legionella geestiana]
MRYIAAVDQGTSSTRAMLYALDGTLVRSHQVPLTQYYPKAGEVEHCPEEIIRTTLECLKRVLDGTAPGEAVACGLTNQRETTLLWDRQTGKALSRAIVWQDRRTHAFCESLSKASDGIQRKTGLLPDAYFSASKLRWLLDEIPDARQRAEKGQLAFGTVDSWLLWHLTGGKVHATDITNASRTLLFNIIDRTWDEDLLALFDIPASVLPEVKDSDAHYGVTDSSVLGHRVPLIGVAGDQQAALIGQRCFEPGMCKATFGTGGFLLMNTGTKPVYSGHRLLTTVAYAIQGKVAYGLEGSLYHAGTTVKWLRDALQLITTSSETETLAESLTDNGGVYLVPAFTGLGAPYWTSAPGAAIFGLTRESNRAHFARAALESVCYQTREVLACMRDDAGFLPSTLRVDGGMAANGWFLQYLASQCGVVVQKPHDIETTALGAAFLAGLGASVIPSPKALMTQSMTEKEWMPLEGRAQIDRDFSGWQRAVKAVGVFAPR